MSRDDGFSIADVSTSLLDDPKFRSLWRALNDPAAMAQAVTVYLAAVLESWRSGERANAVAAAPMWLPDVSQTVAALTAADLLDGAGQIPEHVWQSWYGPAAARRKVTRDRWQRANDRRQQRGNSAVTSQSPRGDIGDTVRPSVPTDRSLRTGARRRGQEPSNDTSEAARHALTRLADLLPHPSATPRTPPDLTELIEVETDRLEDASNTDPEHWIERAGR